MLGGLAFLLHGNMSCGIHGNELIVRIDPETAESALAEPGTRIFDITGRPMKGWLLVGAADSKMKQHLANGYAVASTTPHRCRRSELCLQSALDLFDE